MVRSLWIVAIESNSVATGTIAFAIASRVCSASMSSRRSDSERETLAIRVIKGVPKCSLKRVVYGLEFMIGFYCGVRDFVWGRGGGGNNGVC